MGRSDLEFNCTSDVLWAVPKFNANWPEARNFKYIWFRIVSLFLIAGALSFSYSDAALPQEPAFRISVFLSSDRDRCFSPGIVKSIRHFTRQRAEQINAAGGVNGRKLELFYYDDFEEIELTKQNVATALKDRDMIAMIGISSSTRAAAVVDDIGASGIPLISEISRSDLFERYNNIYTMAPTVLDEVGTVGEWLRNKDFSNPAFVGFAGNLYSEQYAEQLNQASGNRFQDYWFPDKGDFSLDPDVQKSIIEQLKERQPEILFLSVYSGPGARFLKALYDAGVRVPVFVVLGRIRTIQNLIKLSPADFELYALAREGVPSVFNERLRTRIWETPRRRWIFNDSLNLEGGESCKNKTPPDQNSHIDDRVNQRAVGRGIQYSDMLSIVADAARQATSTDADTLKKQIRFHLSTIAAGEKIYRGWWQDWSFSGSRGSSQDNLLLHSPDKVRLPTLVPEQFRRAQAHWRGVPVVYIGVDLERLFGIDSNENNFQAEFYLSLRGGEAVRLEDIEFTNAVHAQSSNEKLINIRQIKGREVASDLGDDLRLYKVSGTFRFDPDLRNYPFDKQRFSISFQPADASKPFLIQPQPRELRTKFFEADGWRPISHHVGADQDIISVVGVHVSEQSIIPLYKFNYTWTMYRFSTDFYLRVIVPLIVILLVTYLSVFISESRLESVVAIQVTALLSSIALYLAIPKVEFEHPTISDQVFVVTYIAIFLMLGFSILRSGNFLSVRPRLGKFFKISQIILLPALIVVMVGLIFAQSSEAAFDQVLDFWKSVGWAAEAGQERGT
ncbi:MAG: ABC transporter substrate-binding protein [Methyloligellaceae bacterium]